MSDQLHLQDESPPGRTLVVVVRTRTGETKDPISAYAQSMLIMRIVGIKAKPRHQKTTSRRSPSSDEKDNSECIENVSLVSWLDFSGSESELCPE